MDESKRPPCAGWYDVVVVCDGDDTEPTCAYRRRCRALSRLAGGKAHRTKTSVAATLQNYDEGALDALLTPRKRKKVRTPPQEVLTRFWRDCDPLTVYQRSNDFDHALPIVDAIAEAFATTIGRTVQPENGNLSIGDVYLRFLPGDSGQNVTLYLFTGVNSLGLWIARIRMSLSRPQVVVKVNCASREHPSTHEAPPGVAVRVWTDRRDLLSLVGVRAEHARSTGRYIARIYNAKQIGSDWDEARRFL